MPDTNRRLLGVLALATFALAGRARANDPYESVGVGDDACPTSNSFSHGQSQRHDLQASGAPADTDWTAVVDERWHSYEVRLSGPLLVQSTSFTRRRCDGTLLQTSLLEGLTTLSLRWVGTDQGA